METPSTYPVAFTVDYPERKLNRLSTFFRIFAAIPILILAVLLQANESPESWIYFGLDFAFVTTGAGVIVYPLVLMIVVRKKYPRWWYEWNIELLRFTNRIGVYLALMDDRYPSTDERQAVHLDFPYPDAEELERGMPLVKWLLAFPHYIALAFLFVGAVLAVIGAWFAILFTGRYPQTLFRYVEGVFRWNNRVLGYAYTLVTDEYPPFKLSA